MPAGVIWSALRCPSRSEDLDLRIPYLQLLCLLCIDGLDWLPWSSEKTILPEANDTELGLDHTGY